MLKSLTMKRKLHEISMIEDIKYRGPFSEREFRIMGWICLAFTQVSFFMKIGQTINLALAIRFANPIRIVFLLSSMALPFLPLLTPAEEISSYPVSSLRSSSYWL